MFMVILMVSSESLPHEVLSHDELVEKENLRKACENNMCHAFTECQPVKQKNKDSGDWEYVPICMKG
ncbi:hypothetical protein CRE_22222, partial [Caenorhabditis remanei]